MTDIADRLQTLGRSDALNAAINDKSLPFSLREEIEAAQLACMQAKAEIERHRAAVHSCHEGCDRAGCVNQRLRAKLAAIEGREPVGEMVGHHQVGWGEIPTIRWRDGYYPLVGTKFYEAPVADKDAEVERLRKVMFAAWQDSDWLLIANEVHDMEAEAMAKGE